ncbi:MAG TPA: hypothetical protein VFN40_12545, partial [Gemmatimonadales bacterium]|nr:hypothetical protein [Gemmatimonadales bacterium]
ALAGRGRRRFEAVFEPADLVKFAHWRPGADEAEEFLAAARELLAGWREMGMAVREPVEGS